ncbi:MAG: hypothetical protein ABEH35_08285 [Haloarculaceae archaeon]
MDGDDHRPEDLSQRERDALHQVELGVEHLHRAHGHLVTFHHNTGRAMDHLADAETLLRQCGRDDLADELRDEYLPRGVVTDGNADDPTAGRWSYELLEDFQTAFLDDVVAFGERVSQRVGDGLHHATERKQQRDWRRRARRE